MAINEVYFGDTPLISLKNDTVATANDIMVGKIGHLNNGDTVTGTATNDATITVGNNNTSSHLLSSETAYANGHKITGTMVNRGSGTAALTTKNATYNISEGYYNGTGNITIASSAIADCVEEKIKTGSTILGVSGSFTSDATASAADILGGNTPKTAYVNGVKITGTMPDYTTYKGLWKTIYMSGAVTPSGSYSKTFTLPVVTELEDRPIKWIQIYANVGSSSTSRGFIAALSYTSSSSFKINSQSQGILVATTTTGTVSVYGKSYFTLEDEDLLSTGGAKIVLTSSSTLYWKGSISYYISIGG